MKDKLCTFEVDGVDLSMHVVRGDGWVMVEPGDDPKETPLEEANTEELDLDELWGDLDLEDEDEDPPEKPQERMRTPGCTCGFLPDPNCLVDHMGRNVPDPEPEGGDK